MGVPLRIGGPDYRAAGFFTESDYWSYDRALRGASANPRRVKLLEDAKYAFAPFSSGADERMYHVTRRIKNVQGETIGISCRRLYGKTVEKFLKLFVR